MTSSASRPPRRRCATRWPRGGLPRRSCSPAPAAWERRRRARILARALNCTKGPTPDPCGTCDACVEIAEGRDIDVPGDRRRHPHPGGQHSRGDHRRAGDGPGPKPLQGLHHRRGSPAFQPLVQRAAQVDRGAAAARRVHDGDDAAREDPGDHPVAVAGLRAADHRPAADRRTIADDRGRRVDRRRRRGVGARRARGRRQHARRPERLRSGDRLCRPDDRGRRRLDRARPHRTRPRSRRGCRRRRRGCGRGVRSRRTVRGGGLRSAAGLPRALACGARPARPVDRRGAGRRSGRLPGRASANGW